MELTIMNGPSEFRISGTDYRLTRDAVEEALTKVAPKEIQRYFILVNGRRFPPKQALAEALGIPLVSFTTMDANRILRNLGFELMSVDAAPQGVANTESERLFEEYLQIAGLSYFSEIESPGADRPDYCVPWTSGEILFEVKEFRATPADFTPGGGAYDPYRAIRDKIIAAKEKLRDFFGQHCCALVLYNSEKPLVYLDWQFIYAAMLGNFATRPIDQESIAAARTTLAAAKYPSRVTAAPPNAELSAIVVLEQFPAGRKRFDLAVAAEETELQRELALPEYLQRVERARGTERDVSLRQLRIVVHENPYAQVPFPQDLFRSSCDERYGLVQGSIGRLFKGNDVPERARQQWMSVR